MLLLQALTVTIELLRVTFFGLAAATAVVAGLDWLVRTRRIPPFSPLARFVRSKVTPLFVPTERRIVRAGGNPQSAPWWTLAAVVIGGILVLTLLGFVRGQLAVALYRLEQGPTGLLMLVLGLTFGFLNIALLWRVISTWVGVSPYSRWARWAYAATEWLLVPIRSILPPFGMFDLSPMVAYFLLSLVQSFVMRG